MKNTYKHKTDTGRTIGEIMHHIGKQTTEKVKRSVKDYTRKKKHKKGDWDSWHPDHPLFI